MSDIVELRSDRPFRTVYSPSAFSVLVRLLFRDRAAVMGLVLVILWLGLALFGPLLAPTDPNEQDLSMSLLPPAWEMGGDASYPLGTDHLGRDILTRIMYGARTSLVVGLASVGLSLIVGAMAGVVAGEWGGLGRRRSDATSRYPTGNPFYLGGNHDVSVIRTIDVEHDPCVNAFRMGDFCSLGSQ